MTRHLVWIAMSLTFLPAAGMLSAWTNDDSDDARRQQIDALRSSDRVVPDWPTERPYETLFNREAPVPPQCYTRTEGLYNPCYVCHQARRPERENKQDDQDLQAEYSFSDVGFENHWTNLFEDRSDRIANIDDETILEWVRQDNYTELPIRLRAAGFEGWIPDLENLHLGAPAFDEEGFAKDGSDWVAYSYKPLPSTFWPTNGAFDDVMIRLPEAFRTTSTGERSRDVYASNLALLECAIKGRDRIGSLTIDETRVGVDLDGDGALGLCDSVKRRRSFVGAASDIDVWGWMFPKGTELLHTVRYLDIAEDGTVRPSQRLKEVRYMYRRFQMHANSAAYLYLDEQLDKEAGKLPRYRPLTKQRALQSETGWELTGFIEDAGGRLRASTFEETVFCMGCHNSLGATIDKTFSFARKMDGPAGWRYIDLRGMPDAPNQGESLGEVRTYLERVGGGSEFRNNDEMAERWFHEDGRLDEKAISAAADLYDLIVPSPERALVLNKAYRVLVEDQDFLFGRDPSLSPPRHVYDRVDPTDSPTLPAERRFLWDPILDWDARPDRAR